MDRREQSTRPTLEGLLRGRHRCISMITMEEAYARELVHHAAMNAGLPIWVWSATHGLRDAMLENGESFRDTENAAAGLYAMSARVRLPAMLVTLDLADHLTDPVVARACRDLVQKLHGHGGHLIMIDHTGELPGAIASIATPLDVPLPDEQELELLIRRTLRSLNRDTPIEARLSGEDLRTIIRNLSGLTRRQAEQIVLDAALADRRFDITDLNAVLAQKRRLLSTSGALEYIEAPVDLSEIGGLRHLKRWLEDRTEALSRRAEAFGIQPPRGVLMLGVQGTGKSLCAKAIATAWRRPLVRLDPGSLYDRYVGESERRLREALRQAEAMAPVVMWIDEIEKGFAGAAGQSTDGGLSRRMFGALLTWMQEHRAPVFLVATANDIWALPPELLRKGRFDEIFFVDLPAEDVRREIFAIHLRKRGRDPDRLGIDLDRLAQRSEGFSAAEIEQAVISALQEAFSEDREIDTALIARVIEGSPPLSVTAAEQVGALRAWAEGRCVPAD